MTYYMPHSCYADPKSLKSFVFVPHWWISAWFHKGTWANFEHLYHKGQLRLPTEADSGYALRQSEADETLGYSLFIKGEYQVSHCRSPASARYFLWYFQRPAMQHCMIEMNTPTHEPCVLPDIYKRCMLDSAAVNSFVEKFTELMLSPECIDKRSPEASRQWVRRVYCIYRSQYDDLAMRVTSRDAILDISANPGN